LRTKRAIDEHLTSAPLNLESDKLPIASESFTVSKSTLKETKKECESLLQAAYIENQTLIQQNNNLHLTVEKLTNENKQLTERTTSPNLTLFLTSLFLGLIPLFLIYLNIKNN
jgi:ATP-dependent Zn protease